MRVRPTRTGFARPARARCCVATPATCTASCTRSPPATARARRSRRWVASCGRRSPAERLVGCAELEGPPAVLRAEVEGLSAQLAAQRAGPVDLHPARRVGGAAPLREPEQRREDGK